MRTKAKKSYRVGKLKSLAVEEVGNPTTPQLANPLTGTNSDPLPAHLSAEAIAERAAINAAQQSVYVIRDEWNGKIEEGVNAFDEAAKPFQEANPDKEFRFLSDRLEAKRGRRGYEPVYDPNTGRRVEVAGMKLGYISRERYQRRRKIVEERAVASLDGSSDTRAEARELYQDLKGVAQPMSTTEALDF